MPLVDWFRGSLREFLWDNVTSAAFLDRGLVSPEFLRALLEEHDSGRRDNSHWLWSLLVLSLWFQEMELPVAETVARLCWCGSQSWLSQWRCAPFKGMKTRRCGSQSWLPPSFRRRNLADLCVSHAGFSTVHPAFEPDRRVDRAS